MKNKTTKPTRSLKKILSIHLNGSVYILGTPMQHIAYFRNTSQVDTIIGLGLAGSREVVEESLAKDSNTMEEIADSYKIVLDSDPRMHDVVSMDDVPADIISEPANMVVVTVRDRPDIVVMTLFKCNETDESVDWHKKGHSYKFTKQAHIGTLNDAVKKVFTGYADDTKLRDQVCSTLDALVTADPKSIFVTGPGTIQ